MSSTVSSRPGRPTVLDVAERAAVSVATVSRVMNAPHQVRQALRDRVLQAVEELGYVPHAAAKALASNRTRTIGAVVPTIDNAIFAKCIGALQGTLHASGYSLLLACSEHSLEKELEEVNALLRRGIDGLVLVGSMHDPLLLPLLHSRNIPFVTTWCYAQDAALPCVGFRNLEVGAQQADFLADLGHRELGMIAGITRNNDRLADRVRGVRAVVAERKLRLRSENYIEVPFAIDQSRAAMRKLLTGPRVPTAVVCGNDVIAFGALLECRSQGVDIPRALSIVGVDDLDLAAHLDPPLTTLRVPSADMGVSAGQYLLARMRGENCPDHSLLNVELIVRGSTGIAKRRDGAVR